MCVFFWCHLLKSHIYIYIILYILYIPYYQFAPENRPNPAHPKGSRIIFQASIFRCENAVSFREGYSSSIMEVGSCFPLRLVSFRIGVIFYRTMGGRAIFVNQLILSVALETVTDFLDKDWFGMLNFWGVHFVCLQSMYSDMLLSEGSS